MKKIKIYFLPSIISGIIFINFSIETSKKIENSNNRFKKDMIESIMEFSDEKTPIDSLYIPNWLIY